VASQYQCPFCEHHASITEGIDFEIFYDRLNIDNAYGHHLVFRTTAVVCPNPKCRNVAVTCAIAKPMYPEISGAAKAGKIIQSWPLLPASRAKGLPAFVPRSIVQDYEEACMVEALSAKASATLSRRTVQQIIRDFFGVSEKTLYAEIQAIKGRLPADIWTAIDQLREIGNVGAHPEQDINIMVEVEPEEAAALIRLVEMLIEHTYVARERHNEALAEVAAIAAAKKAAKAAGNGAS